MSLRQMHPLAMMPSSARPVVLAERGGETHVGVLSPPATAAADATVEAGQAPACITEVMKEPRDAPLGQVLSVA